MDYLVCGILHGGTMKRRLSKDTLLFGLALLGMAQVLVFGNKWRSLGEPGGAWLQAGDDVSGLHLRDAAGGPAPVASGERTVLLVFDSQCAHCLTVAPAWRAWIGAAPPGLRVIAVSTEPTEAAEAFVEKQAWGVEDVWRVEGRNGSPEHALTSRTPWVFVLDGEGRILGEGHGSRLAELTEGLSGGQAEGRVP
jgi:hypothetical protein